MAGIVCRTIFAVVLLAVSETTLFGDGVALVREPAVVSAQTPLGKFAVTLQPVTPARDVTVVLLNSTLAAADIVQLRRELPQAFPAAFFASHALRIVTLDSAEDVAVSNATELNAQLRQATPSKEAPDALVPLMAKLSERTAKLAGNWGHVVFVGRFPAPLPDEQLSAAWLAAWIGDNFRSRKMRVSVWALDGAVPEWANELSQSTLGAAADNLAALTPVFSSADNVYQATWQGGLKAGGWPALIALVDKDGGRLSALTSLCAAPDFAPPVAGYITSRANRTRASPDDEAPARAVLDLNPSDQDALTALKNIYQKQAKPAEAADVLRRLVELDATSARLWAELGFADYHADRFDEADAELKKALELGAKSRSVMEARIVISMKRKDFAGAADLLDQALAMKTEQAGDDRQLWLLRADCAHNLNRWPVEAESLERALTLGPLPVERLTTLIEGYLAAGQKDRALPHLKNATLDLPKDAPTQCRYAGFWEQVPDEAAARALWENAVAADAQYEAAYLGLGANHLHAHRNQEALQVSERGLEAVPQSVPLLLIKEQALEGTGDFYAARRLLMENGAARNNARWLERRTQLEDWYGAGGAESYAASLDLLTASHAPQPQVVDLCRRGLAVAIRDEKLKQAQVFADKLAECGDNAGAALLKTRATDAVKETDLPGGVEAFQFLLFGGGRARPDKILTDAARALLAAAGAGSDKKDWQAAGLKIHEYFQRVSTLAVLGTPKAGKIEIQLTLANKPGKQRTEKVFSILGLKLKQGKEGPTVLAASGEKQTKKQDTVSALAIDDQEIQDTLAAGKTYVLELSMDKVPAFPAEELWQQAFYAHEKYPGGLAEAFVTDVRIPRLYLALNTMDRTAAVALLQLYPLRGLAERYSLPLSLFSSALAIRGKRAEVPGGKGAENVWQALVGQSPAQPAEFFQTLLGKDDGRLIAFFYTLSQLDSLHQKFFTRSPERTKRFYALFRETPEMQHGGESRIGQSSFLDFMRNIPLNDDGSVDFPGSPEVWMVAKGRNVSGSSVGKMTRKMKKTAVPDDEDQILTRLATTGYKAQNRQTSELANFIAVTQVDEQRDTPLSVEAALLLAQGYGEYRGLFPYFAELGDLEAADYQSAFGFAQKLNGVDEALQNIRLGEFQSALAMLGLARESGLVPGQKIVAAYRAILARYLAAGDGASWAAASLSAIDDLCKLTGEKEDMRDAAIRTLLIGANPGAAREKSFEQVLALQKVPSLDALSKMRSALSKANNDPRAPDEIERQLSTLTALPTPKAWKVTGSQKKCLDLYETAKAESSLAKLRERLGKKRYPADVERFANQMLGELEPWVELAMVGRVYARFLDSSDMLVSEDSMLLRKHQFLSLAPRTAAIERFPVPALFASSAGAGSYFTGGLAGFSMPAGEARAMGNHIGAGADMAISRAVLASVRATDWRPLTPAALLSFGATVRLAREWIVASASSAEMRDALETQTRGILSINRRNSLLDALDRHDWPGVWRSVSVSDLHFLGDSLLEQTPSNLWSSRPLAAMRAAAGHEHEADLLGPVAPDLSGCGQPRLRRYEPYEEYQRHFMPDRLGQRLAELKLYLAWMADAAAWPPEKLPAVCQPAADLYLHKLQMHDAWDWEAALEAFRSLTPEEIEALQPQP